MANKENESIVEDESMKAVIDRVYAKKMADGTFDKLVSDAVDELIRKSLYETVNDYNSPIRKRLNEKVASVMGAAVDNCDISVWADKIQSLMNASVKGSSLESYKDFMTSLRNICGQPKIEPRTIVKASDIFKRYVKHYKDTIVQDYDLDKEDDIQDDGEGGAYVTVDLKMRMTHDGNKIEFVSNYNEENPDDTHVDYAFRLLRSGSGTIWIEFEPSEKMEDFRHIDDFTAYLMALSTSSAHLNIDVSSDTDEVDVTVERN